MATNSSSWNQVVADFRRICLLKRQGKLADSEALLNQKLPASIAIWSREGAQDALAKRRQLQEMFAAEERRIEEVWTMREILFEDLKDSLLAELKAAAADQTHVSPVLSSVPSIQTGRSENISSASSPPQNPQSRVRPWRPRRIDAPALSVLPKAPAVEAARPRPGFDQISEVLDWIRSEQPELSGSTAFTPRTPSLLQSL